MLKERKIYPKWRATIEFGKLKVDSGKDFANYLIPFNGKEMQVIVKPWTKDRSRQEEKFYHAVVVKMVAEAMEIERQEAHEMLKGMFLRTEESKIVKRQTTTGEKEFKIRYERVMSTTELSDKAYREYWEQCIRWAALPTKDGLGPDSGLELFIPYPNEVDYQDW